MVKFWPEEDGQSVKYGRCTVQLLSSSYKGSCTVNNIELLLHSEVGARLVSAMACVQ